MAHTKDYIPDRDADFDGWLENLDNEVAAKLSAWGHIPQEKAAALSRQYSGWHGGYTKTLGPHTTVDTEAKNDARRQAEAFVRIFVQQYLKFDPVTDEDRTAMRLHNRDSIKTPVKPPATRPVLGEIRPLGAFRVEIFFSDEASPASHARPYGDNGCLLCYAAEPEKTDDYKALLHTRLMTHTPFTLQLEPEAEGRFLSCACRWQNERGELGPWSGIHHIVVS